jgi:hypothetical protein
MDAVQRRAGQSRTQEQKSRSFMRAPCQLRQRAPTRGRIARQGRRSRRARRELESLARGLTMWRKAVGLVGHELRRDAQVSRRAVGRGGLRAHRREAEGLSKLLPCCWRANGRRSGVHCVGRPTSYPHFTLPNRRFLLRMETVDCPSEISVFGWWGGRKSCLGGADKGCKAPLCETRSRRR